jgi:hypothetical protein
MTDLPPEPAHGVNVPLLRKVLEYITEHREQHRQDIWITQRESCGTAGCLAGWAVVLADLDVDWSTDGCFGTEYLVDGRDIAVVAAELIGVENPRTLKWADWDEHLFNQNNTLADLWRIANELTDGEIEIPEELK